MTERMTRSVTTFSQQQLEMLRASYAGLQTATPDCLPTFHALFEACSDGALRQLAQAKIKFVSKLAVNALERRTS
jgi:hypothetical protein